MGKIFSTKDRPVHLGSFPLEKLRRVDHAPGLDDLKPAAPIAFSRPENPHSIVNAMAEYMGMLDTVRVGNMNPQLAKCPDDPAERSRHLKAFAYFTNASMAGTCALDADDALSEPYRNPEINHLAHRLRTEQTKTLAAGMDVIMADLKASMDLEVTALMSTATRWSSPLPIRVTPGGRARQRMDPRCTGAAQRAPCQRMRQRTDQLSAPAGP